LVGAFPFDDSEFAEFVDRVKAYAIEAVREAKVHTAWLRPDSDYEEGYLAFLDAISIAPRFFVGLVPPGERPLGKDIWQDTSIHLPPSAPRSIDLHKIFTAST
jgi:maltooligosyltrehalose synthase